MPNFIKSVLVDLKTEVDINLLIVGDFNTLLSPIDRSSGQKKKRDQKKITTHIKQTSQMPKKHPT